MFARFYRVSAKSHLELSPELIEALIGLMLGDLHAERKNLNSNTRLQFKQSDKNKDYIDHLYNLFKEFCGSAPKITTWFDNRPNRNKLYGSIKFSTFSLLHPTASTRTKYLWMSIGIDFLMGLRSSQKVLFQYV